MSLGKGRWKNRYGKQGLHQSYFCVVLFSQIEHDFNVLIVETKQRLVAFNFHLKQEHAPDTTVFSPWLFCIGRNSLHCFGNVELGILRTKSVCECPCLIYGNRKGYCLKLGSLCCGSLLSIEVSVRNGWTLTTWRLLRVWQQLLR